jgi:hypothetical protein
MNFTIAWIMDKFGYMPKIDMEIGKVKIDTQSPEFKMWPFPVEEPKAKRVAKKATTVAKKKTPTKTTKAKK